MPMILTNGININNKSHPDLSTSCSCFTSCAIINHNPAINAIKPISTPNPNPLPEPLAAPKIAVPIPSQKAIAVTRPPNREDNKYSSILRIRPSNENGL